MTDRLFLFPESFDTNPSSFLQNAIATISRPFRVENFKLFAFIERFDEVDYPFVVAPVKCNGKFSMLYQYRFSEKLPDFKQLGLEIFPTENGDVLYLSTETFSKLSSKYRSISIKSGHWPEVAAKYHRLAAFSHLDVIPPLSKNYLKSDQKLDDIINQFHELYDLSDTHSLTLSSLYFEVVRILQIFCFAPLGIFVSPDVSSYYFGAIRSAVASFHEKCFSQSLIGNCCLTPATMKQLWAMFRFVKDSLRLFGYDPGADFHSFSTELHKFQADNGLPTDEECNEQTMKLIWKQLLLKKSDPIAALLQVDVPVKMNSIGENEKFGKIDPNFFDKSSNFFLSKNKNEFGINNESAKQITARLSEVIDSLPSPGSTVVTAQKQLLSTARFAADHFSGVNNGITNIQQRIESIGQYANEVMQRANEASDTAESSLSIISGLNQVNEISVKKIENAKLEMEHEVKRTRALIIIFAVLLIAYFLQKNQLGNIQKFFSLFKSASNTTKINQSPNKTSLS